MQSIRQTDKHYSIMFNQINNHSDRTDIKMTICEEGFRRIWRVLEAAVAEDTLIFSVFCIGSRYA
jgi:hypothetical protein